ncbi:MAG TPA: hypothetical protein VK629_13605, partial [Steroidobacteraceae bacterium]|nr:hypothetical protein [Steroidobacteraceae bacterium]
MRSAGDYTAAGDSGVADVINAQRSKPCGGLPGPGTPLRSVDELNSAAALLPSGMNIAAAVAGSGYRGTHVRVIRLRNVVTDRKAARIIARNYCDSINSSAFEE